LPPHNSEPDQWPPLASDNRSCRAQNPHWNSATTEFRGGLKEIKFGQT
jgi:hypothetical protein